MERLRVVGGARLSGTVQVSGAKNSALKLMAATLLAPGESKITNLPAIADVDYMAELLTRLGCSVKVNNELHEVIIQVPKKLGHKADYDLVRKMRASINVLGPLIARELVAEVALPGGDAIGSRGLDFHINGLKDMGAEIHSEHGFVIAKAPNGLKGAAITLEFPSVGATENIMTAATLATGVTTIDNAAREPDVVDLGEFLIAMGAKITGLGTHTISIEGVKNLKPTTHATLADRIVSGTWAFAAVMTKGDITIENGRVDHLEMPLDKLVEAGAVVTTTNNGFRVKMDKRPIAVDVATLPYPGFPTDLQPMVIALNAIAEGTSLVTENVFEGRFMFVNELLRLGANIQVDGHHAAITGIPELSAAPVAATDIRAGAGLVLAALVSDGVTIIEDAYHIDRGYPDFPAQLQSLGADVSRN
ncbi:MAG: UDP-N-acetylglucosamine 1-carboxyvinyltransferase [Actinomycetota bacterium]|nr:UDP-N-acetylglucosamine 1-carboxyvinyltransferase [Actinomycetota bacterium]